MASDAGKPSLACTFHLVTFTSNGKVSSSLCFTKSKIHHYSLPDAEFGGVVLGIKTLAEVLSFDCLMVLTLNLYHSTSSGFRAYHYFLTLALGDTLILATSVLCLFVGLYDRIHLDFGQRSVLEFCQHLSLRLAFRNQLLLLRLLVTLSVAGTAEDHVIAIVCPRPFDVFAA